jgi:ssRNA-specific RNase YbeY (16S rRNA maturation enzyme)
MTKILIFNEAQFSVSETKIKKALNDFFDKKQISGEISVAVVGETTMYNLAKTYLGESHTLHNVLTFRDAEKQGNFVAPGNYLGEIVLCYPMIADESELLDLLLHGATHLLGIHHN